MRKKQTPAEALLWERLRGKGLGLKFRRQVGIGPYIVDFFCPVVRLAVELDGRQHYLDEAVEYDAIRQDYMASVGIRTVRFPNFLILRDIETVCASIAKALYPDNPPP